MKLDSPVRAIERYEEALSSNPTNKDLLRNLANCWFAFIVVCWVDVFLICYCLVADYCVLRFNRMARFRILQFAQPKVVSTDPRVIATDLYYLRAVDADKTDYQTLYDYARFLLWCNRVERAEEYFLRSLEMGRSNPWILLDYASFLEQRVKLFLCAYPSLFSLSLL